MKVSELRIGNYLNYYGQDVIVRQIFINEDVELGYFTDSIGFIRKLTERHSPDPIPLTEDVLVRCGFTRNGNEFTKDDWMMGLSFDEPYNDWHVYECRDSFHLTTIKRLHQLQNLYFALTGQELIYEFK
ncbi:MAG: hypothetical protein WC055_02220 [Melioribacteraceae bacterium]